MLICFVAKPYTKSCTEVAGLDDLVPAMGFYHYHISYDAKQKRRRPDEHMAIPDFNPRGTGTQMTPDRQKTWPG